jgi:general secretion pathway protein G
MHTSPQLLRAARATARKGMSLVEIMVVIAIIGVLMTVVAVNVIGYLDEANVDATKIQIKNVEQGLTTYASKHRGKFPSTSEGLDVAKKFFPNNQVPTDAWGNTLQYMSPGRGGAAYEIISLGKDGKDGGEEANADISSATMSQGG